MPAVADRQSTSRSPTRGRPAQRGHRGVRDCGWPPDVIFALADASSSRPTTAADPRGRTDGHAPGGYPTRDRWRSRDRLEVHDPQEAQRAVEMLAARGAVGIKVALTRCRADDHRRRPRGDLWSAPSSASRPRPRRGKGQVERALGAGVREIVHTPWTDRLSDAIVEMLAKRTRMVSTLDIQASVGTRRRSARRGQPAPVPCRGWVVLYGTDLGNGPIPPGIDLREVLLLREAGLATEAVLQATARGRSRGTRRATSSRWGATRSRSSRRSVTSASSSGARVVSGG